MAKQLGMPGLAMLENLVIRRKPSGGLVRIPKGAQFIDTEEKSFVYFLGPRQSMLGGSHLVIGISAPVGTRVKPGRSPRRKRGAKK